MEIQEQTIQHQSTEKSSSKAKWGFWIIFLMIMFSLAQMIGGYWTWWWLEKGRYYYYPKNFGEVIPGQLYRSAKIDAGIVEQTYREHEIDRVIILLNWEPDNPDQAAEHFGIERLGIKSNRIQGLDGRGLIYGNKAEDGNFIRELKIYTRVLEVMHSALSNDERVLVHCAAGAERTGATFAFYELLVLNRHPQKVYEDILRYRHDPQDNPDMIPMVNALMPMMAESLLNKGIISSIPDPMPQLPIE